MKSFFRSVFKRTDRRSCRADDPMPIIENDNKMAKKEDHDSGVAGPTSLLDILDPLVKMNQWAGKSSFLTTQELGRLLLLTSKSLTQSLEGDDDEFSSCLWSILAASHWQGFGRVEYLLEETGLSSPKHLFQALVLGRRNHVNDGGDDHGIKTSGCHNNDGEDDGIPPLQASVLDFCLVVDVREKLSTDQPRNNETRIIVCWAIPGEDCQAFFQKGGGVLYDALGVIEEDEQRNQNSIIPQGARQWLMAEMPMASVTEEVRMEPEWTYTVHLIHKKTGQVVKLMEDNPAQTLDLKIRIQYDAHLKKGFYSCFNKGRWTDPASWSALQPFVARHLHMEEEDASLVFRLTPLGLEGSLEAHHHHQGRESARCRLSVGGFHLESFLTKNTDTFFLGMNDEGRRIDNVLRDSGLTMQHVLEHMLQLNNDDHGKVPPATSF